MVTVTGGQFRLGDVTFGGVDDRIAVVQGGWDRGEVDLRVQDKPTPGGDGLAFGRDFATPPVWTWSLVMWDYEGADVLPDLRRLRSLWDARATRLRPGATLPLYYDEGDGTRVVYGRPRKWSETAQKVRNRTLRSLTCSFQLADAYSYSATERSISLDLVTTSEATGIRWPTRFPVVFGRQVGTRQGIVTVPESSGGSPFKLTIRGPLVGSVSGISLKAVPPADADGIYQTSWTISLTGVTVGAGQTLVVDTANGTVTRDGAPVVVGVGARSALRARLFYGTTELVYAADDPSATSTATLTWRDSAPA